MISPILKATHKYRKDKVYWTIFLLFLIYLLYQLYSFLYFDLRSLKYVKIDITWLIFRFLTCLIITSNILILVKLYKFSSNLLLWLNLFFTFHFLEILIAIGSLKKLLIDIPPQTIVRVLGVLAIMVFVWFISYRYISKRVIEIKN